MLRKRILLVAAALVMASSLSAFVAYRFGLRHRSKPAGSQASSLAPGRGGCVEFLDAGSHVGEATCVSGRVLRVFTSSGGNTFFDFCPDYRKCPFTSVIFVSDHEKFGDLHLLEGRQVEIQGQIRTYQGRAEIIIRDLQQIRVLP